MNEEQRKIVEFVEVIDSFNEDRSHSPKLEFTSDGVVFVFKNERTEFKTYRECVKWVIQAMIDSVEEIAMERSYKEARRVLQEVLTIILDKKVIVMEEKDLEEELNKLLNEDCTEVHSIRKSTYVTN